MLEQVARTWAERAQAELGAAQRFKELSERMQQVSGYTVPTVILRRVEKAEQDEDRHAFLCAKMARKFGHETGFSLPQGRKRGVQMGWGNLGERDKLLLDVTMMGCITESLNASLLNSIYSNAGGTEAGKLIHQILKDEVQHAQIGWSYLAEECKARDCSVVSKHLVEMVEYSLNEGFFLPMVNPIEENTYPYGVMSEKDRVGQFKTTLEEVVCTGFEHFGIDASPLRDWIENIFEA